MCTEAGPYIPVGLTGTHTYRCRVIACHESHVESYARIYIQYMLSLLLYIPSMNICMFFKLLCMIGLGKPILNVINEVISKAKANNSTNPEQPFFQRKKSCPGWDSNTHTDVVS